jgi:hypothetical protein
MRAFFGSLAQLVEQRTFNPLVAGSNPARPTKEFSEKANLRVGFFVLGSRKPTHAGAWAFFCRN